MITFANRSPMAQKRWVRATLPTEEQLPDAGYIGAQKLRYVVGHKGLRRSKVCYIEVPLNGLGNTFVDDSIVKPKGDEQWIEPGPHPSLVPDVATALPKFYVSRNGQSLMELPLNFEELVSSTAGHSLSSLSADKDGFWVDLYVSMFSDQDVIEINGWFGWLDPTLNEGTVECGLVISCGSRMVFHENNPEITLSECRQEAVLAHDSMLSGTMISMTMSLVPVPVGELSTELMDRMAVAEAATGGRIDSAYLYTLDSRDTNPDKVV